jgi:two-component system OmpR family sensor kinase
VTSIRTRLLLWLTGALLFTGAIETVLTVRLGLSAFNDVRDNSLQLIAYSVVRHGVLPDPEAAPQGAREPLVRDLGHFATQIWTPTGQLVYSSLADGGPPRQTAGLHVLPWAGEDWRVYTLVDPEQTVQVSVTAADRRERFARFLPWVLAPLLILVLVLGLLIQAAVQRALRPLNAWGRELRRRDGGELHPVGTAELPAELVPLGEALNGLLARVDALLSTQRRLVAEAAHELNTPLAAVKLQAQLTRRSSEATRAAALDELDRGIERATRLVAQLLQAARLEPGVLEHAPQALRLDALAAEVVAAFSAQAEQRGIDLGLAPSEQVWVDGDEEALRVLLNNLVDNALRYVPEGGRVDVAVRLAPEATPPQARLQVDDDGPGIPAHERPRALQRFVRLQPAGGPGSGLGLAIVAQVVERHGGRLSLGDSPLGGLSVRVSLPARRAPA